MVPKSKEILNPDPSVLKARICSGSVHRNNNKTILSCQYAWAIPGFKQKENIKRRESYKCKAIKMNGRKVRADLKKTWKLWCRICVACDVFCLLHITPKQWVWSL